MNILGGSWVLRSMVISRVIIRVTPFRARISLLITYLLSPLPLQVLSSSTTGPQKVQTF